MKLYTYNNIILILNSNYTLFLKYFSKKIRIQSLWNQCLNIHFKVILIFFSVLHRFVNAFAKKKRVVISLCTSQILMKKNLLIINNHFVSQELYYSFRFALLPKFYWNLLIYMPILRCPTRVLKHNWYVYINRKETNILQKFIMYYRRYVSI